MEVNGKILREKILELFPDRSYNLTDDTLEELCNDSSCKEFLNWFCSELSSDNVLTEEEVKLVEHIKKSGEWLEGEELDKSLMEVSEGNLDFLQIPESHTIEEDLSANYSLVKMAHESDEVYLQSLEKGIRNLKDIENRLDERLEEEQDAFEKLKIEEKLAFEESLEIMAKFVSIQRKLSDQVEQLVATYSLASQKKGSPCVWTQLPLGLFLNNMETYYEYLKVYIKNNFGTSVDDVIESEASTSTMGTEPDLNLDHSNEKQAQEKILEIKSIHQRLSKAKLSEIIARARTEATQAMVNYAHKIYNDGDIQMPKIPLLLSAEIAELRIKRDSLEMQVAILKERQIPDAVERFVNSIIDSILVKNAKAAHERREHSIRKLENLLSLTKNHGHHHSDLLYILIELENQKLSEAVEFISDVRNYLEMDYSSCVKRCDWMQNAKEAIFSSSLVSQNIFNQCFLAMMDVEESPNSLERAMEKLNKILEENEEMKERLSDSMINNVNHLRLLDSALMKKYNREFTNSWGFSHELEYKIDKTEKNLQSVQSNVLIIRNQLKEMTEKLGGMERERAILWQKFLVEPETVKSRYEELIEMTNQNR